MIINTLYDIGDKIVLNKEEFYIIAVHLYKSNNIQTERYYIGKERWITIKRIINENEKV